MSNIPYSGGTIVNTTFTTTVGTRQEIVTALETHLTTAGWTVISGSGTGTVVMKSATTAAPKSNSIRVRLLEVGSGNCAQVKIENDAGTLTSQAHYLLPSALKVFRIIACKYNFFVFNAATTTARSFLAAGTLHIPSHLEGLTTADLGWIQGNGESDSDTSIQVSFRTVPYARWCSQIFNNALSNCQGTNGVHELSPPSSIGGHYNSNTLNNTRWSDDSIVTSEARLGFGATSGAECKLQGFIHNCLVATASYAGDDVSVSSYDSHAWFAITQSNAGSLQSHPRLTLFAAIT